MQTDWTVRAITQAMLPVLLALTLVVGTIAAIATFGSVGITLSVVIGLFTYLGQKDALGPAQALYSLFDTQVSLLRGSIELLRGKGDGTWEVDTELREAFE